MRKEDTMSPTPSQLLRPTVFALASRGIADDRRREGQIVKTMPWRNWLSHVRAARFGVYHSLGSDS
jgi:hypothetical protein